jgi:hypothetical protein
LGGGSTSEASVDSLSHTFSVTAKKKSCLKNDTEKNKKTHICKMDAIRRK